MPLVLGINNSKSIFHLGGALVFAGAAGYIFYQLFHEDDDEYDDKISSANNQITPLCKKEIKIPQNAVGIVIGRQGHNMKIIQEITGTNLNFLDVHDKNGDRTCVITGREAKVEEAKNMIIRSIKDIPVNETSSISVPRNCIGKIIGRRGENINSISKLTGAKIKIPDEACVALNDLDTLRSIYIKGSIEQIEYAKTIIEKQIDEYKRNRYQIRKSAECISLRNKNESESSSDSNHNTVTPELSPIHNVTNQSTTIEAYVTAMDNAAHFWIQVCDHNTILLAELLKEMTEYYSDASNRELHEIAKPSFDDVVAAQFPHDERWYRGRVVDPSEDDDPVKVPVYFVDFGDTELVAPKNICELRTDFLKLKFLAVECILADVDPGSLDPSSSTEFTRMTSLGKGKAVTIKIVSYDLSGIPKVQISTVTNGSGEELDAAQYLVDKGLARWNENSRARRSVSTPPKLNNLNKES